MARIRSIKPEFWRDDKIAALKNKNAAFFFIGLWNVADDEGKFKLSAKSLALELPIFRTKEVVTYLSHLTQAGLIRESACGHWGLIVNWTHQKIDRPKVPKVKKEEIQWLELYHSSNDREESSNVRRKDLGSDRIEDRIGSRIGSGSEGVHGKLPKKTSETGRKRPRSEPDKSLGSEIFEAYAKAYRERYHTDPVRNRTVNSQCGTIGERLGRDGIRVAEFYVRHNKSFYVSTMHPIGILLKDAEALRTQCFTGKQITGIEARAIENRQQLVNAFGKFLTPEEDLKNDISE